MRRSPIWERGERRTSSAQSNYVPHSHGYASTCGGDVLSAVPDCVICPILQLENKALLERIQALKNNLSKKEDLKIFLTERRPSFLCKILLKKREEINRLNMQLRNLSRDNDDLQWRLESETKRTEYLEKSLWDSLRKKEETTEKDSSFLWKILQKKREEIDHLNSQLRQLKIENANLWKQTGEVKDTIESQEFENQKERIQYLKKALEVPKTEYDSKNCEIIKLKAEVTRLQAELNELKSKSFSPTTCSKDDNRRETDIHNSKSSEQAEVENLRFEVQILKAENKKLAEKRRQISQEKEDLSLVHSTELKIREEEIRDGKKNLENLETELQSLHIKNKENENKLRRTDQHFSEIRNLNKQISELKEETHTLEKQAENLREENIRNQRKFEAELKQKDTQAQRTRTEIDRLKQVILQLENENQRSHFPFLSKAKEDAFHRDNDNKKKLKLADQDSSGIRYLKDQISSLKEQNHTLQKEVKRLKEEKVQFQRKRKTDLKQRDSQTHRPGSEIERLKQVILHLENENEKQKSQILAIRIKEEDALQRQGQVELKMKTLTEEIQRLKERLLNQDDDNYRLQKELSEVCKEKDNALTRLSKVAGAKVTHGNAAITDLSDTNRPTKIAEKFSELYDNQWTDAFEELDNTYNNEEETIQVLLKILKEAYDFCVRTEKNYETRIGQAVFTLADEKSRETRQIIGADVPVQKALTDLRLSLGNACCLIVEEMFLARLPSFLKKVDVSVSSKTKLYARQCASLCWRMSIRDPPIFVRFEFRRGTEFNTDILRRYTKTGGYVDFIVWPALYLHESGPVLSKGVAQPKHTP